MCTTCSECVADVYVGVKTHLFNIHTRSCTSAHNTCKAHVTLTAKKMHIYIYLHTRTHTHIHIYTHTHTKCTYERTQSTSETTARQRLRGQPNLTPRSSALLPVRITTARHPDHIRYLHWWPIHPVYCPRQLPALPWPPKTRSFFCHFGGLYKSKGTWCKFRFAASEKCSLELSFFSPPYDWVLHSRAVRRYVLL